MPGRRDRTERPKGLEPGLIGLAAPHRERCFLSISILISEVRRSCGVERAVEGGLEDFDVAATRGQPTLPSLAKAIVRRRGTCPVLKLQGTALRAALSLRGMRA